MKTILDVEPVGTRLEVPRLARSPRQRDFTAFDVDLIDSVATRRPARPTSQIGKEESSRQGGDGSFPQEKREIQRILRRLQSEGAMVNKFLRGNLGRP